jgi:hypothetical protein
MALTRLMVDIWPDNKRVIGTYRTIFCKLESFV